MYHAMLEFRKEKQLFSLQIFLIIDGTTFSTPVRSGTTKMAAIKDEIVPDIYIGQTEGHVLPDYRMF